MVTPPPGPTSREIAERLAAVELPHVAARQGARAEQAGVDFSPIAYARTQGSFVEDADGNIYVDLAAGFGACTLGHAPAPVLERMHAAMSQNWLALGDLYGHALKLELCERLARLYPERGARVALGLSGADALTAAIKTCALYTHKPGLIAFTGGYHGLSYAPLAACGLTESFRAPFAGHLGNHVTFAPYPSSKSVFPALATVEERLRQGSVGGVIIEPILGRGGCVPASKDALAALRTLCDKYNALLVFDEVWTGLGRCGALLAAPPGLADIVCVGKGLGAGVPISACIGRAHVMECWGEHGGATVHTATHFGSPGACAAALATLDTLAAHDLPNRARRTGDAWRNSLKTIAATPDGARAGMRVTGAGLMIGLHFHPGRSAKASGFSVPPNASDDAIESSPSLRDPPTQRDAEIPEPPSAFTLRLMRALLERGYITVSGGKRGDVLTLTPALTIDETLLAGFDRALHECLVRA